jgi:hypothetical protein
MMNFKDWLFVILIVLSVAIICVGLSLLIAYVSLWFIVPTAIFVILWPWLLFKIAEWWVWR